MGEGSEHNFGAVLRRRAAQAPGKPVYTFLRDGGEHTVSYGELHGSVCALASRLAEFPRPAQALLLYPHGLEFIRAFWACLLAGIAPVPCYPPRNDRSVDRLLAIAHNAQAAVVLTDRTVLSRVGERLAEVAPCLVTEDVTGVAGFEPVAVGPAEPAFLQYTSGSTGAPKGVVVSHENLHRNQELIRAAFGQDSDSTIVSWLPFYHDMGLIGNVLHAVFVGAHAVFLSPVELLRRPLSWLEAVSRYRATGSGGPNFGFQHCVDRIADQQIAQLDLSHWRVAYCGAELVRASTLQAFADWFAAAGFRAEAFRPCYGMAEATLLVSAAHGADTRAPVVSCGVPEGFECLIVDRDGVECPDGVVGEVWLSGASIASGYWHNPEASQAFQAVTSDGRGPFYRTGDLGFLSGGELHVTGRIKELVIIRGRNHYPYDLEWAIAEGAPGVVRDGCVVFSVDLDRGEELIVQCEYERTSGLPHAEVIRSVRTVLLEEFGIAPAEVFLVGPRRLPRTSSGKLQRALCRSTFLAGQSTGIAHWPEVDGEPALAAQASFPAASDAERLVLRVVERLKGQIQIGRDDTFFGDDFTPERERALLDDFAWLGDPLYPNGASVAEMWRAIRTRLDAHARQRLQTELRHRFPLMTRVIPHLASLNETEFVCYVNRFRSVFKAGRRHRPQGATTAPIALLTATRSQNFDPRWSTHTSTTFRRRSLDGDHFSILDRGSAAATARAVLSPGTE